jgi:hypothetical protein
MKIVSAYHVDANHENYTELPDLENKTGKSFNSLFTLLKEGDHATVLVEGRGYKEISIENGQQYIQRNFAYDY